MNIGEIRMEARRVQLTGRSSYVISLPKSWAKRHGISKGSQVFVEELADGSLRIIPKRPERKEKTVKEVSFSKEKEVSDVLREVLAAYLAGYDIVKVKASGASRKEINRIKEILEENVLGFDVLEESSSEITFYAVIDQSSIKFMDALSKAFLVAESMIRDVGLGIETKSAEILRGVIERDQIVDKLYLLGMRQLTVCLLRGTDVSEIGIKSPAMIPHVFLAAKSVERVADHCCTISSEAISILSEGDLPEDVLSRVKMAERAFLEAKKALLRRGKEAPRVAKILEVMRKESVPKEYEVMDPRIRAILESVRRIISYSLDIAEVSIDLRAIEELSLFRILPKINYIFFDLVYSVMDVNEIDYRLLKLESDLEKIVKEVVEIRREISWYKVHPKEKFSDDEGKAIWW